MKLIVALAVLLFGCDGRPLDGAPWSVTEQAFEEDPCGVGTRTVDVFISQDSWSESQGPTIPVIYDDDGKHLYGSTSFDEGGLQVYYGIDATLSGPELSGTAWVERIWAGQTCETAFQMSGYRH